MQGLEAKFCAKGVTFDADGNRVRCVLPEDVLPAALTSSIRCFPHVINLAVQAIYTGMKSHPYAALPLPELEGTSDPTALLPNFGMTRVEVIEHLDVLASDLVGTIRKTVAACRASGQRRSDFKATIEEGNSDKFWRNVDGTVLKIPVLQLLRDCDTRWSSTFMMLDRTMGLYPVSCEHDLLPLFPLIKLHSQAVRKFLNRPKQSEAKLNELILDRKGEVLLKQIHETTHMPHLAQEVLSSQRTPTLSFSLPLYTAIIEQWTDLKCQYPLLSPHIQLGIDKIEDYVGHSRKTRIYALAIGNSIFLFLMVTGPDSHKTC